MLSRTIIQRSICAAVLALASGASADVYDCSWYTFDAGGGVSVGGPYRVSGTIGQPDAGRLGGGAFTLQGGFWVAASAVPCSGFIACDTNCDGSINGFDIAGFVDALGGAPGCSPCSGDANGDGSVNGFDIAPFVACLNG